MNRRSFVISMLLNIMSLLKLDCVTNLLNRTCKYNSTTSYEDAIHGLFSDVESAKTVGKRYISLNSHSISHAVLLNNSGLDIRDRLKFLNRSSLKKELNERCKKDFIAGHTILIDGWILSRSEISLCGLLALDSTNKNTV